MNGWERDKKWSDQLLPQIKSLCGLHLIGEPPVEEDRDRNTDLVVLKMDAVRIGCRVRRHQYLEQYGGQFTIRSGRPLSGNKTELAKIIEGWGDFIFYGFADEPGISLTRWFIGDLNVFRVWHSRKLCSLPAGQAPGIPKANGDGSSTFVAFQVDALPPDFVVAFNSAVLGNPS